MIELFLRCKFFTECVRLVGARERSEQVTKAACRFRQLLSHRLLYTKRTHYGHLIILTCKN